MNMILASTSPFRKQLLEQLGFTFSTRKPTVDEEELKKVWSQKNPKGTPKELCLYLAQQKCESIAAQNPKDIVIGCDQLVELKGEIFGKSENLDSTLAQMKKLNGQTHQLWTALVVKSPQKTFTHVDETILKMRKHTDSQLKHYVEMDQGWESAGGYKIEKHGILLFENIQTNDHTAIIGLPVMALMKALTELDYKRPL